MIVVDTNILVYLTSPGERSLVVEHLSHGHPDWAAPKIWRSEYMNAMFGLVRRHNLTPNVAKASWDLACKRINNHEYDITSRDLLSFATATKLTAYDAEFVMLAEALGVPLVTYDKQVLRECPRVAVTPETFCA